MIAGYTPVRASIRPATSAPFGASRNALVAYTCTSGTPAADASSRKRVRADASRSSPSGDRFPDPSRHSPSRVRSFRASSTRKPPASPCAASAINR